MKKLTDGIVKLRIPILILGLLLLIPSIFSFAHTRINYDILYYLPDSIETMQGQDILMDEFGKCAYGILVCEGMEDKDVTALADEIKEVDHVTDVIGYSEISDILPPEMLPDELKDTFYSEDGDATLLFLFMDTGTSADETMDTIETIRGIAGQQCFLSSMSAMVTDTRNLVESQVGIYVVIAVILSLIVLMVMMDSFLVPVMFLIDIGMAILYNLGTNFIQGEISYITMALVAVLQLGVTMDYSIFLYNAYREQKASCPDKCEAMSRAILETLDSVTGSSLTTIAGFVALCFMSFTLGLDLGVVMAKGVLLGVICCVTLLPALLLTFDGAIQKTSHKTFKLHSIKLGKFITRFAKPLCILMVLLWIPAIYGNNNVQVYYKLDSSLPEYLGSVQANEELQENFDMNSVSMVLVDRDLSSKETKAMLSDLDNIDGINFALGLDSVVGSNFPDELVPDNIKDTLTSENWKLILISSEYQVATTEAGVQCDQIKSVIKNYDSSAMLIGEAACTQDLITITAHDFAVVSSVSIGLIFILILLVLKSALLPALLVAVIELAIYINMSLAFYTGTTLPFIASIVIGTIQLGATVDYAILMTTQYKHSRLAGAGKTEAVQTALDTSLHSIFTSALGFFAATIGVGVYSDVDMLSSLCVLMARGAIISFLVVMIFLPSVLTVFDGLICRTTVGMRKVVSKERRKQA